jgi:hypothetical protein
MRAAVIANASAGRQTAQQKILTALCDRWQGVELYGVAGYGGEWLPKTLPEPAPGTYLGRFSEAMTSLLAEKPDLLVSIGGDGTSAYAADWLLRNGISLPIFGFGAGTANVGPIVTEHDPEDMPAPDCLQVVTMGAIEALDGNGNHIAYGFNDLVLGNTLLGSVDGQTVTLDAYAMASEGAKRTCRCLETIAGPEFKAQKNGNPLPAAFPKIGQLVASAIEKEQESFYGRAVTGLLCFTPGSPHRAAVYLSSVPIVTCEEAPYGYEEWMVGAQILLQEGDTLHLEGLAPTVCAVADGNPYLLPDGSVTLRYVPNLLKVLTRR